MAEKWTSANAILARMDVGSLLAAEAFPDGSVLSGTGRGTGSRGRTGGQQRPRRRRSRTGGGPVGTLEVRIDALLAQILPGGVGGETREKIIDWGDSQDSAPSNAEIATLILGSPEFQRR
jgi:hypothetical protein